VLSLTSKGGDLIGTVPELKAQDMVEARRQLEEILSSNLAQARHAYRLDGAELCTEAYTSALSEFSAFVLTGMIPERYRSLPKEK